MATDQSHRLCQASRSASKINLITPAHVCVWTTPTRGQENQREAAFLETLRQKNVRFYRFSGIARYQRIIFVFQKPDLKLSSIVFSKTRLNLVQCYLCLFIFMT